MYIDIYKDNPSYPFIKQIFNHCPEAGSLYCFLWEKRDENNFVNLNKKDISFTYHPVNFRNNLRKLNVEGLISYVEDEDGDLSVELVNWEDME